MLILSSNGLSSDNLLNEVKKYIDSSKRTVAIVTTASVGYKEHDWNIPRLTEEMESLGLEVIYFDIDERSPKELAQYDVIEFIGGNPYYLLNSLKKANSIESLNDMVKDRILIGISAGSLVLEKTIEIIDGFEPQMNDEVGLTDFSGMGLTDIQILPHYHKFVKRYERCEERIIEYENKHHCNLIKIDDGQAVFINDNYYRVV